MSNPLRQRGQSSIELALFLPLFLLILLGMSELGNAWYGATRVAQAAHEGAELARRERAADPGAVELIVEQVLGGSGAQVSVSTAGSAAAPGGTLVTVTVTLDLPLLTGNFLTLFEPFQDGVVSIQRSATALYLPS